MFNTKKQRRAEAEEFVSRLAEVRADMDSHPPTIIDLRELETHLRGVHIGAEELHHVVAKPTS